MIIDEKSKDEDKRVQEDDDKKEQYSNFDKGYKKEEKYDEVHDMEEIWYPGDWMKEFETQGFEEEEELKKEKRTGHPNFNEETQKEETLQAVYLA